MNLKIFVYLTLFFLPFIAEATIVETATIETVIPLIDEETWIVVDLDNTTFEGKQAFGHTEWFYDKAYAIMEEGLTLDEATRICYPEWIEIQKKCPVKPVEPAFIHALGMFQEKGNVVMALTHRQPSLVEATLRQINSLDLDFQLTAPVQDTLVVPSETPTLYIEGVLFTGEYNKKGEIFVRFLSMIDKKPKKVLFIDDKRSHVEDVKRALTNENIDYIGVHYTANSHIEKVYSRELAELQKKYFNTILSNEAALLLMQHELDE